MKNRYALFLLFLLPAGPPAFAAESYPSRPIDLISPTGPGGGSDLVARMVADIVQKEKLLPQPMIVQNKPGGRRGRADLCSREEG